MRAYIIRRLLLIIPTLLILSIIVFLLVRFIPGDAVDMMVAKMVADETMGGDWRLTVKVLSVCWD